MDLTGCLVKYNTAQVRVWLAARPMPYWTGIALHLLAPLFGSNTAVLQERAACLCRRAVAC